MHLSQGAKLFWAILLSVLLTNIPHLALAETVTAKMIPTTVVIGEMNRAEAQEKINNFLSRADVQKELMKHGISKSEAETRLASLSENEMKQLASQMDKAQAGGDLFGLLILVVLVLLIIYLAKRI
jgi:hypothetical protein